MNDAQDPAPVKAVVLEEDFPVSYSIYAMARVHRAIAAAKLAELGLFPGQEIMLMQLDASDGLSQKTLAAAMRISHVTVVKMVARLEHAGLVARRTATRDRRVSLVYLTTAGKAVRDGIVAAWAELEALTAGELDERERRSFLAAVRKIQYALDATPGTRDAQPG